MSDQEKTHDVVRKAYGDVAKSQSSCYGPRSSCCGPKASCGSDTPFAAPDQPVPEAELGLSCGNPVAFSRLKEGQVVLDLGSGAGKDVFLAAQRVGPQGRVIGVDMTVEMLQLARRNAEKYRAKTGLDNVEFRLGEIEHLPIADSSVDVVLSNCVINLSPDKPQVWREVARVLKPGGTVAVSDIALLKPLPQAVRDSLQALVGCLAGASLVAEIEEMLRQAGLVEIRLAPKPEYVEGLAQSDDALYQSVLAALPPGATVGEYATSLDISARKPGGCCR